jgi:hypothetical protein
LIIHPAIRDMLTIAIANLQLALFKIGFCNPGNTCSGLPYIDPWLRIALHFSWNFFQGIIFGFNVSVHVTYSLITQSRTSDNLWNGGSFGFEGSILALILQVLAIAGLWWYYSNKTKTTAVIINPAGVPLQ